MCMQRLACTKGFCVVLLGHFSGASTQRVYLWLRYGHNIFIYGHGMDVQKSCENYNVCEPVLTCANMIAPHVGSKY